MNAPVDTNQEMEIQNQLFFDFYVLINFLLWPSNFIKMSEWKRCFWPKSLLNYSIIQMRILIPMKFVPEGAVWKELSQNWTNETYSRRFNFLIAKR